MKIKVIALFLALVTLLLAVGCSGEGASTPKPVVNNQQGDINTDWIGGNPIPESEITLVAYVVSGSDTSGSVDLKVDMELPEVLDTSYEEKDYYNYAVRYKLENDQMVQTAIKKRLDAEYKALDANYSFLLPPEGATPFKYDDDTWGVVRDVTVVCNFRKESIKVVIFGLDASEVSAS